MAEEKKHTEAVRSSAIIGIASLANIAIGLIKIKLIAILLGPSGIGLIGLFQNLVSTVGVLTGLGINNVGTRQIAEAVGSKSQTDLLVARRALFWSAMSLCALGFCSFMFLAYFVLPQTEGFKNSLIVNAILAAAVLFTIAAGSQSALLTGMRRIGDIAKISIVAALISAGLSVLAIWGLGYSSISLVVLLTPLSSFFVGIFFVQKIPKLKEFSYKNVAIFEQLKIMAKLGFLFMLGGLISTLAQLVVRTLVNESEGVNALGEFQAAWQISMLYLGFVLTAMGTDYYPKLTESIKNKIISTEKVNEQTEVAVLLAAPVLFLVLGSAPWLISLLYTNDFKGAGSLLTWQILGDALKVVSWPLGFVVLAIGDGKKFLMAEALGFGSFVLCTWLLLPRLGLVAPGIGFICLYAVYLPTVYYFARQSIDFKWTNRNVKHIFALCLSCGLIKAMSAFGQFFGLFSAMVLAVAAGSYAVIRLTQLKPKTGLVGKLLSKFN